MEVFILSVCFAGLYVCLWCLDTKLDKVVYALNKIANALENIEKK